MAPGQGAKIVGIVFNPRVPATRALAEELARRVKGAWLCSALDVEGSQGQVKRSSLVITVGGDGTILRTVRVAAPLGVPLVGVNMGRVGFMTELRAEEALDGIAVYLEGKAWVEERMMLQAQVLPKGAGPSESGGGQAVVHGLNDAVVGRGATPRLIFVEARVDGAYLTTYAADGVIVATATGSSGYALSAGGPIIYPQAQCLLMKPVASHLSPSTALVLPPGAVIDLTVQADRPGILSVDGFTDLTLTPGDVVRVQRSPYSARFLRVKPPHFFYETLWQRLVDRGGQRPRAPET